MNMLQIDTNQALHLPIEGVIGQRIAVLRISGSGKTNTVAVLAEELLPHVPLTICDVEGEYYGLKQKFDLLVAGRSEHAEVPLFVENAAALAEMSIRRGISVILDLSEYDQEEMPPILLTYFSHLWKLATAIKTPYEVVIEEAHEFVAQGVRTPLKTVLTRFALRGRKRGIGIILASQRSAKVEKDLLTQANLLFLQNVVHPTDLSVYKDLIPLAARDVELQVRDLAPGEAFVVRGKQVERVHIRLRHTYHPGATPTLGEAQPHLKMIDAALLQELREMTHRSVKEGGSDELSKLRKQLKEAGAKIIEQQSIIQRQEEQIALLSRLSVHNDGTGSSVPSKLEIDQIQRMQATATALHTSPIAQERVVEATDESKAIEQTTTPPLNEKKFASLQKRLQRAPQLERDMLRILVEQEKPLTAQDVAAWLNKPESTIKNNPPHALLKLGIMTRSRGKHGYIYRSVLAEYLRNEFPHVDVQQLQSRLVRL
jgi:hypothetical protein